jgi:hypothetical protein
MKKHCHAKRQLGRGRDEGGKLLARMSGKHDNSEQTLETQTSHSSMIHVHVHVLSSCTFSAEESASCTSTNSATALGPPVQHAATSDTTSSTCTSTKRRSHRRSDALAQQDYDDLIVRSRGWVYDPAEAKAKERTANPSMLVSDKPHHLHRDRLRNRALTEDDFDQYIFAPRTQYAF